MVSRYLKHKERINHWNITQGQRQARNGKYKNFLRIETDGGSLSGVSSISSQPVSEGTVHGTAGSQSRWSNWSNVMGEYSSHIINEVYPGWGSLSKSIHSKSLQFHDPYRPYKIFLQTIYKLFNILSEFVIFPRLIVWIQKSIKILIWFR